MGRMGRMGEPAAGCGRQHPGRERMKNGSDVPLRGDGLETAAGADESGGDAIFGFGIGDEGAALLGDG